MDNAHLPNSHPNVTPDWRPYPFKTTQLLDAIKTSKVEATGDCRYAGSVPRDWCSSSGQTIAAHGGYCTSVLLAAAIRYSRDQYAEKAHDVPLSISVEFLTPVPQAEYEVILHDYGAKGNVTSIRAEIVSPKVDTNVYCIALIRLRRRNAGGGYKSIQHESLCLPHRLRDCGRWTNALFYHFNPPTSTVRLFTPHGLGYPLWSEKFGGQNTRWQWTKLDDGHNLGLFHLPVIADLIPAIPLNYEKDSLGSSMGYHIATLSLRLDFRCPNVDEEWLVSRTTTKKLQHGIFDMHVDIVNDRGNIIATSTQSWSMVPRRGGSKTMASETKL